MHPDNLTVDEISELIKLIGYGKFMLLLFIITLLINISFIVRNIINNRGAVKSVKIFQEQINLLVDIKEILQHQYSESVSLEQCEAILKPLVIANSGELIYIARDIIENNHIKENKEYIELKLRENIDHIWQENRNVLGKFKYKTRRISEFMDNSWTDAIYKTILRNIYACSEDDKRIKAATRSIKTHFENMKLLMIEDITNY